jgi:hypothetical protein
MPKYNPRFKKGDIVAHVSNIGKYYIVLRDNMDGTYEVRLKEDEGIFTEFVTYFFMEEYLLSKEERRNKWLEDLLKNNDINDNRD